MRAIVKEGRTVELVDVAAPTLRRPDDVIVRVLVAGICRTDLHVASGALPSADPITLGHEFCGRVIACGDAVTRVGVGDLVTGDPVIGDGFLGVTHHGAFADQVLLPEANLHALPELDPRVGAYVEPIAAALAVPGAGMTGDQRGVVYGDSRFSRLVVATMRGFDVRATTQPLEPNTFDYAIETSGTERELGFLVEALKPSGLLVLKSRNPGVVGLSIRALVDKQITVRAVRYGSFARAIDLLRTGELDVADFVGQSWPASQFRDALARAASEETHKLFLSFEDACAE